MENPAPAFLDPLLEYLSSNLPWPIYSVLIKLLSSAFAAVFAFISLCNTLLNNAPGDWNAQNILPPIITIFLAYLALSSFYRTTTWLLRISFWFMKWGTMFAALVGGVGYLLGTADGNAVGNQGGIAALGGLLGSLLQDPRRQPTGSTNSRNRKSNTKRPKPYESFDRHREWQYQKDKNGKNGNSQAQEIISQIADAAGNMFGGVWYGALKSASDTWDRAKQDADTTYSKTSAKSKGKGKAGSSRSR